MRRVGKTQVRLFAGWKIKPWCRAVHTMLSAYKTTFSTSESAKFPGTRPLASVNNHLIQLTTLNSSITKQPSTTDMIRVEPQQDYQGKTPFRTKRVAHMLLKWSHRAWTWSRRGSDMRWRWREGHQEKQNRIPYFWGGPNEKESGRESHQLTKCTSSTFHLCFSAPSVLIIGYIFNSWQVSKSFRVEEKDTGGMESDILRLFISVIS